MTGCSKVSLGCKYCYAERLFPRVYPGRDFSDVQVHAERLNQPLRWRRPRRVFVNSMSDLFHDGIIDSMLDRILAMMCSAGQHIFQILTKRPERMQAYMSKRALWAGLYRGHWDHLWFGVSAENPQALEQRRGPLSATPARVRFLSLEPLLEPIDDLDLAGIDWVIVGGESGPGARPMQAEWVRAIRDQCVRSGVPFFFKQWGGVRKKHTGRVLDGRTWDEMPGRTG